MIKVNLALFIFYGLYNEKDFYTTSASQMPISKQTGLPINKIYIDENQYQDLYSSNSDNYLSFDLKYQNCKKFTNFL